MDAAPVTGHQDALVPDLARDEIAGVRNLALVSCVELLPGKNLVHLTLEPIRRNVVLPGKACNDLTRRGRRLGL